MAATLVYLIRHAETTWNAEGRLQGTLNAPLSARGRLQVERIVEAMRPVALAAVYSSPLERALDTARPLAEAHDLRVRPVEGLREMNQGEWEGRLFEEAAAEASARGRDDQGARLAVVRDSPAQSRLPGCESMEDVQRRAVAALADIAAGHPGETVAVVAHGGVNKCVLLAALGAPLGSHWRIRQQNGCVNVIEAGPAGFPRDARVITMNDNWHLQRES